MDYCEDTNTCRHVAICKYFGDIETPVCKWACDYCKDPDYLRRLKAANLADEEYVSTQRQYGAYDVSAQEFDY